MTAPPRVLVIVVSTDDGRWLEECLPALQASRGVAFDVTVIANACTDATDELCRAAGVPTVRVERRLGFAAANNLGLRAALGRGYDYSFLLNPDTRVDPDAVARLVGFLDARPEYAVLGSLQFDYADLTWTRWNEWSRATVAHARELGNEPVAGPGGTCLDHYYVQGAAMMLRLGVVPRVGLLDPVYGTFYEETDLCRRCLWAGQKVGILFDSRVQHHGGGNWRASHRTRLGRDRLFLRNQFLYYLSDPTSTIATAIRLLARQVLAVACGREDVTLPWWEYPWVLAAVCAHAPHLAQLRARNWVIRNGRPLPRTRWSVGPAERAARP